MITSSIIKGKLPLNIFLYVLLLYYALDYPNAVYLLIGVLLAVIYLVFSSLGKIIVTHDSIVVASFCILYFLLDSFSGYSLYAKFAYGISLLVMYVLGSNLAYGSDYTAIQKLIKTLIDLIYYGIALFIIICIVYTYVKGYKFSANFRTPLIFWNSSFGSSTHFGTMSAVPMAISTLRSISVEGKKRPLNICIMLSMIIANLLLSNRVGLLFFAVYMIISILLKYRRKTWGKKTSALLGVLFIVVVVYILYSVNAFGVQTALLKIPTFERIQLLNEMEYTDPRLERQLYIVTHFYQNVGGGGYFYNQIGDSHNVWLDIYDRAGILPFSLFLILTITLIGRVKRMWQDDYNDVNSICIITIIGYLVSFTEEPAFRSTPTFMILFFFCAGLIIGYTNKNNGNNCQINE